MRRAGLAAIAFALVGCLDRAALECADGTVCPLDRVCIPGGCALPEQLSACDGVADGTSCTFAGIAGECLGGVCLGSQCGNGKLDDGEACDDGNVVSGDGCRADCAKAEVCGDSVLDEGEACDDGNANPVDGCDASCRPTAWMATATIGGTANATAAGLHAPKGIALDPGGNVYIADTLNHRVVRVDVSGVLTTIAGTSQQGITADTGLATTVTLYSPEGVAVDGLGNTYIADTNSSRIRRVDPYGIITTIAGASNAPEASGDNGPATAADLSYPSTVIVDGLGNVFVADTVNCRVRKIDTAGIITTVAGTVRGFSGDGGPATAAALGYVYGIAFDKDGQLLIADTGNHRIRRVSATGIITTIAGATTGCGTFCTGGYAGDNGPATSALLDGPSSVSASSDGSIYIADSNNSRIRRIGPTGTITTVAGTGSFGFKGDGGPATAAELGYPSSVFVAPSGTLYVGDTYNNRIRSVSTTGTITTIAGSGSPGYSGDGLRATSALLGNPSGMVVDSAGNLYVAEEANHRIRKITPAGLITTVAGTGDSGYRASDEGARATTAWLNRPEDVDLDAAGNLYIADTDNHRIRKVDPAGIITTVAGTTTNGYNGDGIAATSAQLSYPKGITHDPAGNLYIADWLNERIRRVDSSGIITTVAGTGTAGGTGDGNLATLARLSSPLGLAFRGGELFIADSLNNRVRKIDAAGKISTIAGTGTAGFSGDGGAATSAMLSSPTGLSFDASGALLIGDLGNHRVRRVSGGTITTILGSASGLSSGDGGLASGAQLAVPYDALVDATGNLFVSTLNRIRRVAASGLTTTVAGLVDPPGLGPLALSQLADPRAFAITPAFTLVAGGTSGTLQVVRSSSVEVGAGRYDQTAPTGVLARFRDRTFGDVHGVALDPATNVIYISETSANRIDAITMVDPDNVNTWTIAQVVNVAGISGFADGGASTARLRSPTGLLFDPATHRLYIADTGNHVIRVVDLSAGVASAQVTTIAGLPATLGYFGDGGLATSALLFGPTAIARCPNGDLFVADAGNHRVRRIAAATGTISTVVGDGVPASSGEGAPSSTFPIHAPAGLACDALGNLFVTSSTTIRLLPADDSGVVDGSGRVMTIYGEAPRTFPASVTSCLTGIASVDATTVRALDSCTGLLVELHQVAQ